MAARSASVFAAVGLSPEAQTAYERIAALSGSTRDRVAEVLSVPVADLPVALAPLEAIGAVSFAADLLAVRPPAEVVQVLLARLVQDSSEAHLRLEALTGAMTALNAATLRPESVDVLGHLDGEISRGGDPLALLRDLIERSAGELLWFRPDLFRAPGHDPMAEVIAAAVAAGRPSRAVYPARALHEVPETLAHRASIGEEIRLVADLPTRMLVVGATHAVLPEPLGFVHEPRLLARQLSVVQVCTLLFEQTWERAVPVPELERGVARPDLRRFVLQQLAAGIQDEQIARTLGVSLRTVRRRIAAVMSELGADTRFQAGVEASRRGWL